MLVFPLESIEDFVVEALDCKIDDLLLLLIMLWLSLLSPTIVVVTKDTNGSRRVVENVVVVVDEAICIWLTERRNKSNDNKEDTFRLWMCFFWCAFRFMQIQIQ